MTTQGAHIWNLIDAQRPKTNLTQVAKKAGVPRETLSRIANDKQDLGADVAAKLAKALGVKVEVLVLPRAKQVEKRAGLERRLRVVEAEADRTRLALEVIAAALKGAGIALQLPEASPRSAPIEPP